MFKRLDIRSSLLEIPVVTPKGSNQLALWTWICLFLCSSSPLPCWIIILRRICTSFVLVLSLTLAFNNLLADTKQQLKIKYLLLLSLFFFYPITFCRAAGKPKGVNGELMMGKARFHKTLKHSKHLYQDFETIWNPCHSDTCWPFWLWLHLDDAVLWSSDIDKRMGLFSQLQIFRCSCHQVCSTHC